MDTTLTEFNSCRAASRLCRAVKFLLISTYKKQQYIIILLKPFRNKLPCTQTTLFRRLCDVHNVWTTSYERRNDVVCVLGTGQRSYKSESPKILVYYYEKGNCN